MKLSKAQTEVVRKMREGAKIVGSCKTHYVLKPYNHKTYYQKTIDALEGKGVISYVMHDYYTLTPAGKQITL